MKKFFVILALAGMTASVSATVFSTAGKSSIASVTGDPKKKKDKKTCCSADTTKACCKGDEKAKCTEKKDGCCKDKHDAAPAPAPTPTPNN